MDKPTAIARLLRRARSAAAASADAAADADGGELDLEAGIARIFAAIRSGAGGDIAPADLPEDSGATYALLSRLDQLWQTPEPGQS